MSVVTKEIAKEIAKILTAKKADKVEKMEKSFSNKVLAAYNKSLPQSIRAAFKSHPQYFRGGSYINLSGNGWSHRQVSLGDRVVHPKDGAYWSPQAEVNQMLTKLDYEIQDAKKEIATLVTEIESALLSLRTYKRIEEKFPEAFKVIPEKVSTALIVNLDEVRAKL